MARSVAHFAHPAHELKLRSYTLPRMCDLCGDRISTGVGYGCRRLCYFDLHEECARFPETLPSFFAHPWHDLTLSAGGGAADAASCCDICREDVPAGVFLYRCAPCGFAVHPRCSRLPQTARSDLHPGHDLTAVPAGGTCGACRRPCNVWVYRCGPCKVDLHIACVQGAPAASSGAGGGSDAAAAPAGDGGGDGRGAAEENNGSLEIFLEELASVGMETVITAVLENL